MVAKRSVSVLSSARSGVSPVLVTFVHSLALLLEDDVEVDPRISRNSCLFHSSFTFVQLPVLYT